MLRSIPRALSLTAVTAMTLLGMVSTANAASPQADAANASGEGRMPAPVINEVETNGDDVDWVELGNPGQTEMDLSGYVLTDSEPGKHRYTLPKGTVLPAGGLALVNQKENAGNGFDFGLGSDDAVRLYAPDSGPKDQPVVEYHWTEHAKVTWGRCPDLTGQMTQTFGSTPGKPNTCEEPKDPAPSGAAWPGSQSLRNLDAADESRGDWSGIDVEPSSDSTGPDGGHGHLWVAQNGDGELYRLSTSDRGQSWEKDSTWKLRYPEGDGTVDAEGVTLTADVGQGLYVSTERNNDRKDVSRPSIMRYDIPTEGAGKPGQANGAELTAAQEWNLAKDFPGLGANSGLEGVTWVPDSWLTKHGFKDQATKAAYDPTRYPGHGDGLFAVGVEGTGEVYLYALMNDGDFKRVATVNPGFDVVADVQFDADRNLLWVVCDDACDGRIATYNLRDGAFHQTAVYRRPAQTQNYANEGFAIAPIGTCQDGQVATYYVDDNNTDDHSLRTGSLTTTCPDQSPSTAAPTPDPSTTTPGSQPSAGGEDQASTGPTTDASHPAAGAADSAGEAATGTGGAETAGAGTADTGNAPSGMGQQPDQATAEPMARTGVPTGSWLTLGGALALIVAGLFMHRASREH